MCGIAGVVYERRSDQFKARFGSCSVETQVSSMVALMGHRGPAGNGVWTGTVGRWQVEFGHTRLAILDLSDAARQPMIDEESGCILIFNGEIYNFAELRQELEAAGEGRIRSSGDTEVLLKAYVRWGEGCVPKLRGMFAFAVYAPRRRQLFLARDQFGIKPLYFVQGLTGQFAFASEVRPLLQLSWVRRDLDPIGLLGYLAYGSVQDPYTLVSGIHSLLPGHTLSVELEDQEFKVGHPLPYWQFDQFSTNDFSGRYEDVVAHTRSLLSDSVRLHLISDAPLGIFLSGGLDSGSILALASAQSSRPLESINVSFEEAAYDESSAAHAVATHFGARHTTVRMTAKAFLKDLPLWLESQDQPGMDGANTWVVSRASKELGLTVALSGLGGDELFAGYSTFQNTAWARRVAAVLELLPASFRAGMASCINLGSWYSIHIQKLAAWIAGDVSVLSTYLMLRRLFVNPTLNAMLMPWINNLGLNDDALPAMVRASLRKFSHEPDVVRAVSVFEISTYLRSTLLRDSDQMGMAHSLEIRVPFIDREVVGSIASLPGEIRTRGTATKPLLVACLQPHLRPAWGYLRKKPFSLPFDDWLRRPLRGAVEESLNDLPSLLFRREVVSECWADFLRGRSTIHSSHILSLYAVASWLKRHRITGF